MNTDEPLLSNNPDDQSRMLKAEPPAASEPPLTVADAEVGRLDRAIGVLPARVLLLLLGLLLAVGALLAFLSAASEVYERETIALDRSAGTYLHSYSTPALDAFMRLGTTVGSTLVITPLLTVLLVLLWASRRRREAVFLVAALAGSLVLNYVLKVSFQRPRPRLPWSVAMPDYSFPSGHSMNSLSFYLAAAVVAWVVYGRRVGIPAVVAGVLVVVWVGTSRIYLGYHYFTDVVGGYSAALIWLVAIATAIEGGPRLLRRRTAARRTASSTGSRR